MSEYEETSATHDDLQKRMNEGYVCDIIVKAAYVLERQALTPEGVTTYPILVIVRDNPPWYSDDAEEEFFVITMTPNSPQHPDFSKLTDEKKNEIEAKINDLVRATFLQES